jgi:hypothetical protein
MRPGKLLSIKGFLFLLFLTATSIIHSQQFLVNTEWNLTFGNDTSNYFYKHATVKTDASNNVYTLGSSLTSTGHDFFDETKFLR